MRPGELSVVGSGKSLQNKEAMDFLRFSNAQQITEATQEVQR
jgi:hypothetical protein